MSLVVLLVMSLSFKTLTLLVFSFYWKYKIKTIMITTIMECNHLYACMGFIIKRFYFLLIYNAKHHTQIMFKWQKCSDKSSQIEITKRYECNSRTIKIYILSKKFKKMTLMLHVLLTTDGNNFAQSYKKIEQTYALTWQ